MVVTVSVHPQVPPTGLQRTETATVLVAEIRTAINDLEPATFLQVTETVTATVLPVPRTVLLETVMVVSEVETETDMVLVVLMEMGEGLAQHMGHQVTGLEMEMASEEATGMVEDLAQPTELRAMELEMEMASVEGLVQPMEHLV